MMINAAWFFSALLFSFGLFFVQNSFFNFCIVSVKQLDILLSKQLKEDAKQRAIIKNLIRLVKKSGIFFFQLLLVIFVSLIPLLICFLLNVPIDELQPKKTCQFIVILIGGAIPFFIKRRKKETYPAWHKLLHALVLPNYNIHNYLFRLESKLSKNKEKIVNEHFVIVTGLARSGTTAMCELLFSTLQFHSLTYANMPFLLAPNLWKKIHSPKQKEVKERAHKDGVFVGVHSLEALEEYFFKAQCHDAYYIQGGLGTHDVDQDSYNQYLNYQKNIQDSSHTTYLAKNNNFILHYEGLRAINKEFKVILMFRYPDQHALSLMRQNDLFNQLQKEDPFVLDYMNWLGHHEFGIGHIPFQFGDETSAMHYKPTDPNYWLERWIDYYAYVLSLEEMNQFVFIHYQDLLEQPIQVLSKLSRVIDIDFTATDIKEFEPKHYAQVEQPFDNNLLGKAHLIFDRLKSRSLNV